MAPLGDQPRFMVASLNPPDLLGNLFWVVCGDQRVPLVLGIGLVLSDDVLHRNKIWWKRGFLVIANGFANGLLFALVAVSFASCSQRAVMAPYVR